MTVSQAGAPPRTWTGEVKRFLGRAMLAARVHRWARGPAPVILAFHRVNDRTAGDGLTCGVALFEAYCRFLARYYSVRRLSELIDTIAARRGSGCDVAITFDDGYADNYERAAPLLERYGLPATFYIVTGFVGTAYVPFWDRGIEPAPAWMTWDQVRDLRRRGFDIGAHTVTHADLGAIDVAEAEREIIGSRDRIARELGSRPEHFAYPFGGERNVREETRALVADAGFRSCVSCHGGSNACVDDPYALRRLPIASWYDSPYQMGFDLVTRRI